MKFFIRRQDQANRELKSMAIADRKKAALTEMMSVAPSPWSIPRTKRPLSESRGDPMPARVQGINVGANHAELERLT